MLKPMLARGELHTIGATTLDEYRKHIEKDAALERRFQPVQVGEPTVEDSISILRGLRERYEIHHGVKLKDSALVAAAVLSQRYITDRFLPDKAIDLVDEAAARLRMEIDSMPAELDEIERRIMQLEIEREALRKEKDKASKERLERLEKELANLKEERGRLAAHWQQEKDAIQKTRAVREEIEQLRQEVERAQRAGDYTRASELQYGKLPERERQLQELETQLQELQRGQRMLKEEVDEEDIAEVVSRWTRIPVSRLMEGEIQKLIHMEERLHQRVVGQDEAITAVANAMRRARAGLQDPNRPLGSFLFLGPTGVGKTELARALAEFLFDDEHALIRIDMSEYQEKHTVSRLIGAPPGYVGYDEAGQLTEAVRRRPYSVVLFDEIEKAHADVLNVLLQLLDDGRLTDSKGRTVDFKNTVVIMTSNIGSQFLVDGVTEGTRRQVQDMLRQTFRPEFLNRVDEIIFFHPLGREHIRAIIDIQLARLMKRLEERKIRVELTDSARDLLIEEGYDPGVRRAAAEADDSAPRARPARAARPRRRVPRRRRHHAGWGAGRVDVRKERARGQAWLSARLRPTPAAGAAAAIDCAARHPPAPRCGTSWPSSFSPRSSRESSTRTRPAARSSTASSNRSCGPTRSRRSCSRWSACAAFSSRRTSRVERRSSRYASRIPSWSRSSRSTAYASAARSPAAG